MYYVKKCKVISGGNREKEVKNNVAHISFLRTLSFDDEMDFNEFKILLADGFDDIFPDGVIVDCDIAGNICPADF